MMMKTGKKKRKRVRTELGNQILHFQTTLLLGVSITAF